MADGGGLLSTPVFKADLHTHTIFSDGKTSAEDIVIAAIKRGLGAVGISDHSYTPFDESYCMKNSALPSYLAEIAALKEKYKGKIRVLAGLEEDLFSAPSEGLDYSIGSVHYLKIGESYIPVDESPSVLRAAADEHFGGDVLSLCELYYEEVGSLAEKDDPIVGHFDLIAKFNQGDVAADRTRGVLFSEDHPRYVAAWKRAADRLLLSGKIFEINTGAIHRGYRSVPYPSKPIFDYLKNAGASFAFGSDSHSDRTLGFAFREIEKENGV